MTLTRPTRTHAVRTVATAAGLLVAASLVHAKLPAPSDEAKARAAETAAKTAHGNKVADFQLCKSQNAVAASYRDAQKKAGKPVAAAEAPACADPGPFVYTPPAPAGAPAAPAATATPAATTAAAPAPKKP